MSEHTLCIVVPCHNEEETVDAFYETCEHIGASELASLGVSLRYVFVNDGSKDNTLDHLKNLAAAHDNVCYLSFSRNFGKEAGLYAGLTTAVKLADLIAVMDADLQDPPSLLPEMCAKVIQEGYDRVAANRVSRDGEPPIRSWFAHRFYQMMNSISDVELRDGARDFSVMNTAFVEAVLSCGEYNRFTKGLFGWVGFKTCWVSYKNIERVAGETNWSFWSLVRYAVDGLLAYSTKPLEFLMGIGIFFSFLAICGLLFVVIRALAFGDPVAGWPSLMATLLLLGGVVTFGIGILGLYLSKIYTEVKGRPVYIIREQGGAPLADKNNSSAKKSHEV